MRKKLTEEERKERKKASQAAYALKNKELIAKKSKERRKQTIVSDEEKQRKKEYNAEYQRKNKEILAEKKKQYDVVYYKENKKKILEYQKIYCVDHKEKIAEAKRLYREKNKDRRAEYNRAYKIKNPEVKKRSEHKRRAAKKGSSGILSKGIIDKLFKLQKGKCPCCKLPLGDNYHIDHITPLSKGGTNTDDNVQLLKSSCNNQKYTKSQADFMWSKGFLL